MGLWSGPSLARAQEQPTVEERATYRAPRVQAIIGNYADVTVNATSAAQSVAIRSTADLIASLGSELPINVWTEERGKRRKVTNIPGALDDPGGDERGREDWGYRLLWSWLLAGNAFGDVVDRQGPTLTDGRPD